MLKEIYLGHNLVSNVLGEQGYWSNLRVFDLSSNKLSELGEVVWLVRSATSSSEMKVVSLESNQFFASS